MRGANKAELAGAIALCPPSALQDLWSRRFPDPVTCLRLGLDAGAARARASAASSCRWSSPITPTGTGLTATIAATGASEIWVTHGQEDALVHWAELRGLKARPLAIVGYGDEDESDGAERPLTAGLRMNRFAELLDRLAYEPGRNNKLRLITDYFREHARSRSRLGAGGAHRRAHLPARQARRRSAR